MPVPVSSGSDWKRWLDIVRIMWPECPAFISPDGRAIIVKRAYAIRPAGSNHVCA